jgi:hypothetical protein
MRNMPRVRQNLEDLLLEAFMEMAQLQDNRMVVPVAVDLKDWSSLVPGLLGSVASVT